MFFLCCCPDQKYLGASINVGVFSHPQKIVTCQRRLAYGSKLLEALVPSKAAPLRLQPAKDRLRMNALPQLGAPVCVILPARTASQAEAAASKIEKTRAFGQYLSLLFHLFWKDRLKILIPVLF